MTYEEARARTLISQRNQALDTVAHIQGQLAQTQTVLAQTQELLQKAEEKIAELTADTKPSDTE